MSQLPRDEAIEEIREVRHRISERFGHDPQRLLEYYMQQQEQYKDRFLQSPKAVDAPAGSSFTPAVPATPGSG